MVRIHPEWQNSIQQEGLVNALTSQSAERIQPQGKTAFDRKRSKRKHNALQVFTYL